MVVLYNMEINMSVFETAVLLFMEEHQVLRGNLGGSAFITCSRNQSLTMRRSSLANQIPYTNLLLRDFCSISVDFQLSISNRSSRNQQGSNIAVNITLLKYILFFTTCGDQQST
ncbi:PREDICTED: uncharacterized protein LOC108360074 [Rhagoletis zephyria]|uniref:uncharacterized protein LOC108360074 n=1 Tax=Rhagoletis zephyria TaxID=28612 RepID=UPI0008112795|nr:PREDICTED: uncharacterized protein LOC108360074 [Rhagoletis zephyria]